eukprot:symbB.v1.2.009169.t1/scaffold579.1/size184598/3
MHIETADIMHVEGCNQVWAGDLSCETKALVRKVYARDFELLCHYFGYCDVHENTCLQMVPDMCPTNLTAKKLTATYCGLKVPGDGAGMPNPYVEVDCLGEKRTTQVINGASACTFNNFYNFSKHMSEDDFTGGDAVVAVYHQKNSFGFKVKLGQVTFSLEKVYHQDGHLVPKDWFVLVLPDDPGKGCGYVELSLGAYAPGDTVPQSLSGGADIDEAAEVQSIKTRVVKLLGDENHRKDGSQCQDGGAIPSPIIFTMARISLLSMLLIAVVASWALSCCFVAPKVQENVEHVTGSNLRGSDPVGAAMLGAVVAAAPTVALAGNSGYALLQLGWAVFIISLGPAVLFWVYFNKPELL